VASVGATLAVLTVPLAISPLTAASLPPPNLPCVGVGVGAAGVYQEVEVCPPVAEPASSRG
jgi:hypothetical protein